MNEIELIYSKYQPNKLPRVFHPLVTDLCILCGHCFQLVATYYLYKIV